MSAQGTPGSLIPRRSTKLEAVNFMLRTIHERPISSLDDIGIADAQHALDVLEEQNREVQTNGWHFNTHINHRFDPQSGNKLIKVPTSCLKVRNVRATGCCGRGLDVIQDGEHLYDLVKGSFEFDHPIWADWVELKDFERIPEAARSYIRIKAARIFVQQSLGSVTDHSLTQEQEYYALAVLRNSEGQTAKNNILWNNWGVFSTVRRDRW